MEALRLGEAEVGVSKPDLDHEPCDAFDGPGVFGCEACVPMRVGLGGVGGGMGFGWTY